MISSVTSGRHNIITLKVPFSQIFMRYNTTASFYRHYKQVFADVYPFNNIGYLRRLFEDIYFIGVPGSVVKLEME